MTSESGPGRAAPRGLEAELAAGLASLEARGLLRALAPPDQAPDLADFLSNDFLGLARHPEVAAAAAAAALEHGAGSRASRLLGGGSPLHAQAEARAARWLACESTLLFPSGYQANLGVLCALAGRGDAILSDALNHASLVDAARLARAQVCVYRHLDLEQLDALLRARRGARRRLVVTESVFSMDGDLAPLAALHELCERHDAWLIVDEAHAAGLLGPEGAGAWAALRRPPEQARRLACRIVTAGKALGAAGAFVAGSEILCRHVVNVARTFMYTTAPPPAVPGALLASLEILREADGARRAVLERARRLAASVGLPPPDAAILPFVLGAEERALEAAAHCRAQGLGVMAVRPPTVPHGTSRLRIAVHAHNSEAECQRLIDALARFPRALPGAAETARRAATLFVVGTDTGVGKTVVSALLLRAARAQGTACYWKPVQTGSENDTETVRRLAEAPAEELLPPLHRFPLPASPHQAAAAAGARIELGALEEALERMRLAHPGACLVVEPAGGLFVPLNDETLFADWLARARPAVALVARSGLGTLNHTLLTLEALRSRGLEPRALFLVGEPHPANCATLRDLTGIEPILELPHLEPLDGESLERWLARHDLSGIFAP